MNILFILLGRYPHIGGVSSHIENITQGLQERKNKVEIISNTTYFVSALSTLIFADFISFLINFINPSFAIFYRVTVREKFLYLLIFKKLKKSKWDILICEDVFSFNITAKIIKKLNLNIPIILMVHGYPLREYSSNYSLELHPRVSKFLLNREKLAYQKASLIIAVDKRIKDYILSVSGRESESVNIIYNFVNISCFNPVNPKFKKTLRKNMGFSEQDFLIFCPRRLVPKNGVIYAVEAAHILFKKDSRFFLLIAGDGPQRKRIKFIINKQKLNKSIKILGGISHNKIKYYYWISDVVLIPSVPDRNVEEATSISALEAMACGIPVIASNIGGLKEIIVNLENGFLVPPKDPESIAQTVFFIGKKPTQAQKIRDNAIKFVTKNHSQLKAAEEIESLCRNLTKIH